jgi:hypothetical protein
MVPVDASVETAAFIVVGLTVVLTGWCQYQIKGRRFRRRTMTGAQRFLSYGSAVFTQLWEGLVMSVATILMWLALLGGAALAIILFKFG